MNLTRLLQDINYACIQGDINREVSGIAYDSRKVSCGTVFVCISGAIADGHVFAADAARKGAVVIIAEKSVDVPDNVTVIKVKDSRAALARLSAAYFGHPAKELKTIGITGTKGKTTATYMVRSMLEASGIKTGLIGTIETIIGDEHIPSANTTPESYVVQETFRKMADAGCKCVVMEVSSQGLMLHRTSGFTFDYGIFTNLEPDHIGPAEHKDLDDYIHCKSLLFRQCRHGIFNADDSHLEEILAGHTCDIETYGFSDKADIRASNVQLLEKKGILGVTYHLDGLINMDVEIDIPGKFSVYNSMTAIAICRHFGVSNDTIIKSLAQIRVKGRVELLDISPKFTVMIDYAHNAMSLESLLTTLKEYNPARLVCLFGCGGNRSRERRFEMGEVSSRLADFTVVTSDNPRNEEPQAIIDDIVTGVRRANGRYITIPDRAEAIRYVIENALEGDVIVLAGKGHEYYQEIKGKKYHMDERELAADVARDGNFIK
ncbi:MAG TPA: UDP-N-acetylmuramoyl-L-alanyl-D-glutamate--2,6-diaminopimelate ligase [Lachnospiraceae bacterium]|nr:UDP-N-acetylmuramoyl-L-alanyl-D-glutamate--2,6-diaminopimelate ligase [Lachnospiraceae bacterium]